MTGEVVESPLKGKPADDLVLVLKEIENLFKT